MLIKKLTTKDMTEMMSRNNRIEGIVKIPLFRIIACDLEGFLDYISEALTGSSLLMDIQYEIIDTQGQDILVRVTGDASEIIEDDEINEYDDSVVESKKSFVRIEQRHYVDAIIEIMPEDTEDTVMERIKNHCKNNGGTETVITQGGELSFYVTDEPVTKESEEIYECIDA